jgi:hypothetical protein
VRHRSGSARSLVVVFVALLTLMLWSAPAYAETTYSVINLSALVADNRCNGEPVVLSGDLHIVTSTNPTPSSGTAVRAMP